jgi:hypothetical protein
MTKSSSPTKAVTVRFFRAVRASLDDRGWYWPDDGDVIKAINEAYDDRIEPDGRHETQWRGREYQVVRCDTWGPPLFRVSAVRRDNLPMVGQHGSTVVAPLPLGDDENLVEPAYATFFGDQVVAYITNQFAPRALTASMAMANLTHVDFALAPIPSPGVISKIVDADGVATLEVKFASGAISDQLKRRPLTRGASRLLSDVPEAETLTVKLGAERADRRRSLKERTLGLLENGLQNAEKAKVRTWSEDLPSELLDIFEQDLAHRTKVEVHGATRQLPAEAAQRAALEAYEACLDQINQALALTLDR